MNVTHSGAALIPAAEPSIEPTVTPANGVKVGDAEKARRDLDAAQQRVAAIEATEAKQRSDDAAASKERRRIADSAVIAAGVAQISAASERSEAGLKKFLESVPQTPWGDGLVEWIVGRHQMNSWDSAMQQAHIALQPPLAPGVERTGAGGGRMGSTIDPDRMPEMFTRSLNAAAMAKAGDEWSRNDKVRNDYINGVTDNLDTLTVAP
jgi:hypothetical protein